MFGLIVQAHGHEQQFNTEIATKVKDSLLKITLE